MSQYYYSIDANAEDIAWSVDKAFTATILGDNTESTIQVSFGNTKPDLVTLRADYTLDGKTECATLKIAVVQVGVGTGDFGSNPDLGILEGTRKLMVNPPTGTPPPPSLWVTTHTPGSQREAFIYNGTTANAEPAFRILSGNGQNPIFTVSTTVSLTPPDERPTAVQKIRVGYIQTASFSGASTYEPVGGRNLIRDLVFPATGNDSSLDWLPDPNVSDLPAGVQWPWYGSDPVTSYAIGSGSGFWLATLSMFDAPSASFAQFYDSNNTQANQATAQSFVKSFTQTDSFVIRIAAATTDASLNANMRFFALTQAIWGVTFNASPANNQVSATLNNGRGPWSPYNQVTEINVNVVPSSTNSNLPFRHDVLRMQ